MQRPCCTLCCAALSVERGLMQQVQRVQQRLKEASEPANSDGSTSYKTRAAVQQTPIRRTVNEADARTTTPATETKRFHIGDIISVVDGRLVSLDHIDGVYKILGWMVDEELFTHQLPRVSDECAPALRAAFPDLAAIEVPPIGSMADVKAWFARLADEGAEMWRDVPRLPRNEHARIDPILEAQHLVGADKVITVQVEP